jgi:hypothetical protein
MRPPSCGRADSLGFRSGARLAYLHELKAMCLPHGQLCGVAAEIGDGNQPGAARRSQCERLPKAALLPCPKRAGRNGREQGHYDRPTDQSDEREPRRCKAQFKGGAPGILPWGLVTSASCCLPAGRAGMVYRNRVGIAYSGPRHAGRATFGAVPRGFSECPPRSQGSWR